MPDLNIQLSSANRDDSTPSKRSERSYIIIRKRSGEITDPWAVPFSITYFCDSALPTFTWIVLCVIKFLMKLKVFPVIPIFRNLTYSLDCHIISKAD